MKKLSFYLWHIGIILVFSGLLISCGSGGGAAPDSPASSNPQGNLSGTVQADPANSSASGKNANATVYVVGQQNNATTTDSNGNFTMNMNVSLSGTVLSSPSWFGSFFKAAAMAAATAKSFGLVVLSEGNTHGRKTEITVTDGKVDPISTIYINTVGSITGKATLQGASDHTGIRVFIPGTSFQATTDASGNYTISNVPAGTYDLARADYPGTVYGYVAVSKVTVATNAATVLPEMLLQLSAGANGSVLINKGAAYASSRTVDVSISPSPNAALMALSEDQNFNSAVTWEPVQAAKTHTFSGDYSKGGMATIYIKFADMSGLPSAGTASASVYIDTNPLAALVSPVSITSGISPVLKWQYSPPIKNPQYHVQLGDITFANIISEATVSAPEYTVGAALNNLWTYYWRVAIKDSAGKEWNWAGPWSFTVDTTTVRLISPQNLSLTGSATPLFKWASKTGAVGYVFTLATNAQLANPLVNITVTDTSYTAALPVAPTSSTPYYWASTPVYPGNALGARSDIWSFTLDTVAPAGSVLVNNGDTVTATRNVTLTLSASDANGIAAYYASERSVLPVDAVWVDLVPATMLFSKNALFTLSPGSGAKTVYVWYQDQAGNLSNFSTSIGLVDFSIQVVDENPDPANITGFWGQYSSITLDAFDNPFIVYYERSINNVTSAVFNGYNLATKATGVWTNQVNVSLSSLYNGVTTQCTSIASDAQNNLFIGYTVSGSGLTYRNDKGGNWRQRLIDFTASDNERGTSIATDKAGGIHISYLNSGGMLSYASITTTSTGITTFATSTVDSSMIASYSSVAVDSGNIPHIAYSDSGNLLKYAFYSASTSTWTTTALDALTGQYPAIAIDSNNKVHISYYSGMLLAYITNATADGSWALTTIDSASNVGVGAYSSIAIDSNNKVHIAYYDWGRRDLKYATNAYGAWVAMPVDGQWLSDDVGRYASLAVDKFGKAHISYYDVTNKRLKYAVMR